MTEILPETMVTQLIALGARLLRVAQEHRDERLETLEEEVLSAVRASQPSLLQEVMALSTTAMRTPQRAWPERCPVCADWGRVQSWRPRQILSVCGGIEAPEHGTSAQVADTDGVQWTQPCRCGLLLG